MEKCAAAESACSTRIICRVAQKEDICECENKSVSHFKTDSLTCLRRFNRAW